MADSGSPYRRIAPAPPAKTKARAVASRPESPEERDQREALELAESRKKRFKSEVVVASADLERAKLAFGIRMRLIGAAVFGLSLLTIGMHASAIADGATSIWVGRIGPFGLTVGPFLLVVGGGGAASKDSLPSWWQVGVVVALLIGMILGSSFEIELSMMVADLLR